MYRSARENGLLASSDFYEVSVETKGLSRTVSEKNCDCGQKPHIFPHPLYLMRYWGGSSLEFYYNDGLKNYNNTPGVVQKVWR